LTETFWVNGFGGSSLDALAESAGINRPSLYAAFGDKEAMYLRAIAQMRDQMSALADTVFSPSVPLQEGLSRFFTQSIDLYTSGEVAKGCLVICTGAAEATTNPSVRAVLNDTIQDIDACFFARFTVASNQGEMPSNISIPAAVAIATALLQSLAIRARAGASAEQLQVLANDAIHVLTQKPIKP
jgi:TetR/AcrR family transcriptional regulator, copper-responsive repressor